ncbi:terminase large subunit domain-containing protein [Fibrobacter sp.]|uniref:terminase large subunit domain-containing protein n=1 Tax=Fibrobacter sp. TaxID=35828 RepID=UPI00389084D1
MAEAVKVLSNGKLDYVSSADSIKFSTGSRILSLPSGNPRALRGFSSSCVIIDEAGYTKNPDEVMAAIAPTLTRDEDAELILASTPAGRNSWFYEQYQRALEDEDWYTQKTDIYEAVKQGLDIDVDSLKSLCPDPDVWKMEYEAEFVDGFSDFIDTSILQFSDSIPKSNVRYAGMDVGGTGDRTAVATVSLCKDVYYVEDIAVLRKAEYQYQLQILKELNQKYGWKAGYIDSVGIGNPIAEFANKQVSARLKGFAWSASNKTPVYENARSLIFDRKLVFADHLKDLIVSDFNNISRIVNEAGNVKYSASRNENGHSDAASALFLAL